MVLDARTEAPGGGHATGLAGRAMSMARLPMQVPLVLRTIGVAHAPPPTPAPAPPLGPDPRPAARTRRTWGASLASGRAPRAVSAQSTAVCGSVLLGEDGVELATGVGRTSSARARWSSVPRIRPRARAVMRPKTPCAHS